MSRFMDSKENRNKSFSWSVQYIEFEEKKVINFAYIYIWVGNNIQLLMLICDYLNRELNSVRDFFCYFGSILEMEELFGALFVQKKNQRKQKNSNNTKRFIKNQIFSKKFQKVLKNSKYFKKSITLCRQTSIRKFHNKLK